jgi:NAD(P)-dependent dehydrogenase (short-subunit alcohol dehydrogenase family)
VFVCDIDEVALQKVQAQLPGVTTSVCNIADRAAVTCMVAHAASALGGLDVLINNAGIAGPTASVEEMDPDAWQVKSFCWHDTKSGYSTHDWVGL